MTKERASRLLEKVSEMTTPEIMLEKYKDYLRFRYPAMKDALGESKDTKKQKLKKALSTQQALKKTASSGYNTAPPVQSPELKTPNLRPPKGLSVPKKRPIGKINSRHDDAVGASKSPGKLKGGKALMKTPTSGMETDK